ncbi:NmrA/HSCARG family protein [Paenibacillus sp. P26]|nr:NmrA/HSCARG family protein [Paenibacillus sp. P26]
MGASERIVLVTGATGQQGRAVVRALLEKGWLVRALTRDPGKAAADELRRWGVEVVQGDNGNREAMGKAMRGVYGVFSVQPTEFSPGTSPGFGYDDEVRLGKNVADAAQTAGVKHFIYSSVGGVQHLAGDRNYSKWEIEQYIRKLRMPATILRPVWFMENFTDPQFGLQSGTLATAVKSDTALQLIAVDDIGAAAALAFENPDRYLGATVGLAGDSLTPLEIAASIRRATGKEIAYVEIPMETIRQVSPSAAKTFEVLNNEEYVVDIPELRRQYPALMSFNDWLEKTGRSQFKMLFEKGGSL